MVRVRFPGRLVGIVRLVAPAEPALSISAREQLKIRPRAARLDDGVLLVRLARVFSLTAGQLVHLRTAGSECSGILAPDSEEDQLGDVAEVKSHAAPI